MKIFQSRKLTDAEFVEKIRKQLRYSKRRMWFLLALSVFYLGVIVFLWRFTAKLAFLAGFAGGVFIGIIVGVFSMKALLYFSFFLTHLFGNRKEKLLVAYYDQLHPLDAKLLNK